MRATNSERWRWLVLAVTVAVAAVTTIAATAATHYAHSHGVRSFGGPALTPGLKVAFYTLAGLAVAGAAIAAAFVEPTRPRDNHRTEEENHAGTDRQPGTHRSRRPEGFP